MPTWKDHAIVLRLVDWSETSQVAALLTRDHGKVSATAKGAKRQTPSVMGKFSGGLELLSRGEAVLMTKPGRDLANLIEWDLTESCHVVRRDLRAFERAMYAADVTHHMLDDHDPHPRTFEALGVMLDDPIEPRSLLTFQWALINDCGYRPVLDRDAQTNQPLPGGATVAFSASAGGLVADTGGSDRWRVRASTVDLLHRVAGEGSLDVEPDQVERANKLLCAYCRAILDRHLPTMDAVLAGSDGG